MPLQTPRVSVILNCYNQSQWLAEAVESVLHQTYSDFELIAVDNGSTDRTREVLQSYASDGRVRLLLYDDNQAISKRFNQALHAARGEFISFLYSDDYYLPHKLQRQLEIFDGLPADYGVVYGPSLIKNDVTGKQWTGGSITASGEVFQRLCRQMNAGHPNMIAPMTRKKCFDQSRFYEDIFAEGEAIFFRIATRYKFHFEAEPLSVARDHMGNAGKAIKVNSEIFETCMQRLLQSETLTAADRAAVKSVRASKLRDVGWTAIRINEDASWARERFRHAIQVKVTELFHPRLLAGIALSLAPAPLRARLNKLADRARGVRINSVAVEGYGGTQQNR